MHPKDQQKNNLGAMLINMVFSDLVMCLEDKLEVLLTCYSMSAILGRIYVLGLEHKTSELFI
jgi:hypothetical protein